MDSWRVSLWHQALKRQNIDDMEMAAKLQQKFRTARLEHFVLEPGVKASNSPFTALSEGCMNSIIV